MGLEVLFFELVKRGFYYCETVATGDSLNLYFSSRRNCRGDIVDITIQRDGIIIYFGYYNGITYFERKLNDKNIVYEDILCCIDKEKRGL